MKMYEAMVSSALFNIIKSLMAINDGSFDFIEIHREILNTQTSYGVIVKLRDPKRLEVQIDLLESMGLLVKKESEYFLTPFSLKLIQFNEYSLELNRELVAKEKKQWEFLSVDLFVPDGTIYRIDI